MLSNVPTTLVLGQVWRSIRSLRRSYQDEILLGNLQPYLTRCPPDLVAIRKAGPRQERTDEHERGSDAESGMRPSGTHRSLTRLQNNLLHLGMLDLLPQLTHTTS